MSGKRYIVGLGEALWDVLPDGAKLGGAPANFAYHAGQWGFDAIAISALGKDKLGDETIAAFDERHLDYIMPRVDYPTGTVQVTLDAKGVPTYEIKEDVAWDNVPFTPEIETVANHCMAVCWGSLAQRSEVSRNTIKRFIDSTLKDALKIFDINLRQSFYTRVVLEDSMQRCDVLKINDEELVIVGKMFSLTGDVEEQCRELIEMFNLQMLVLTCGVNGSHVFTKNAHSFLDTPKVVIEDTVGAGDSFTGAFVAAIIAGKTIAEAHKKAVNVSAYVCTQKGAMPAIPTALKF